jgi:hypothetical protein
MTADIKGQALLPVLRAFPWVLSIGSAEMAALENTIKTQEWVDNEKRQHRIVKEMGNHVQQVLAICERKEIQISE